MNKLDYDNALGKQCMSLPSLCEPQIQGILQGLQNAMTEEELRSVGSIVITGCGDSYVAAKAGVAAFQHFANAFGFNVEAMTAMDAARYRPFLPANNPRTLVIGISASGHAARVVEVLRRGNHYGCMTLAITNNPDSPSAREAKRQLIVNTPSFPDPNPGLRNYYASILALYMLAAKMGEAMGRSPAGALAGLCDAVRSYTASHAPQLGQIDDAMFALALAWQDFPAYDFIGDDLSYATAYFGAAKIVETAGLVTRTVNAEDWCHVHFFQRNAEQIGTAIVADVHAPDRSRIGETIHQAAGIGRPILLVSNGIAQDFDLPQELQNSPNLHSITLPDAPSDYPFMLPLMQYVPLAILAGYISALNREPFFRGGGVWAQEGVSTIRSSAIRIV